MSIFNRAKEIVKTIRFSGSPRLYGRSTAGAGDGEEITIGSGLSLVGKVLSAVGGTWDTLTGKPSTFPPESHTHAIADITGLQAALNGKANIPTGPWGNDLIAAGCPYATLHGYIYVWNVPGILTEKSVSIAPAVFPNLNPRIEYFDDLTIAFYTPDSSTYQDIIDLFVDDGTAIRPQFPDWLLSQTVPEFDNTDPVTFANGSATPHVSVGSLYYTADGSVKRRMA